MQTLLTQKQFKRAFKQSSIIRKLAFIFSIVHLHTPALAHIESKQPDTSSTRIDRHQQTFNDQADSFFSTGFAEEEQPEFVIVVPSYNNEKYARRNLESLIHQKTQRPYSIICVNDCSTDKTGAIMESVAREYELSPTFLKIIHNKERKGALANIYNTIHEHCKDHQIVVLVDGDDCISHKKVLERLEKEYANPSLWLTYGQFIFYPSARWGTTYEISNKALFNKELRTMPYVAQHLRTFKAALFKKIDKEDLMLDGKFYDVNADMATMIPMLEMCAPESETSEAHCKFIPDIMCIYNFQNPISDHMKNRPEGWTDPYRSPEQVKIEKVIRSLPPYESLKTLD